jgi:two-component system, NarL family, response regulator LiaR
MIPEERKISLLLVDDDPVLLVKTAAFLSEDFEIAGTAGNGIDAIEAVARLRPDLVILDIVMPVLDGLQAARRLRAAGSNLPIVFLSGMQDPSYVRAAMETGATGYVFKSKMGTDLAVAIREVVRGRTFVSDLTGLGKRVQVPSMHYREWKVS